MSPFVFMVGPWKDSPLVFEWRGWIFWKPKSWRTIESSIQGSSNCEIRWAVEGIWDQILWDI